MGRPRKNVQDPDDILEQDRAEMAPEGASEDDLDVPPDEDEEFDGEEPDEEPGPEPAIAESPRPKKKPGKKTLAEVALDKARDGTAFLSQLPKGIADKLEHGAVEGHPYRLLASETRGGVRIAVYQGLRKPNEYRVQVDREQEFGKAKKSHYAVLDRAGAETMYAFLADKAVSSRNAFPI